MISLDSWACLCHRPVLRSLRYEVTPGGLSMRKWGLLRYQPEEALRKRFWTVLPMDDRAGDFP